MRRLIRPASRQRGATAVIVAISMMAMLGFTAVAIDLGGAYSEHQQLQNGADAGALAIAQSCALGDCVDSSDKYAKANKLDGQATGQVVGTLASPVTVETSSVRKNWFGAIIGVPTSTLTARATAEWGWPSGGATLPLTFSWCAFREATGGWDVALGDKLPDTETTIHLIEKTCTPPAHNEVAGGFGWLTGINCSATVYADNWVLSDPGNDGSTSCKDFDWTALLSKPVLVPIFEETTGSGSNAMYKIKGLAAFEISGYCFAQDAQWNVTKCPADKQIKGHFTDYVDLSGDYTIDANATHFGVATVKLSA